MSPTKPKVQLESLVPSFSGRQSSWAFFLRGTLPPDDPNRLSRLENMNREDAINLVLAEAFAESGLGMLAENAGDPGFERIEALKTALAFLHEELADDHAFDRQLVSAFFILAKRVPEAVNARDPEAPGYRPSFAGQVADVEIYVADLIENWNNWPDWESNPLRSYKFVERPKAE